MFSVVIPLYNKAHTIQRTIRSVLNQTCRDFELIVVNDGSTDGGADRVRQIQDNRIVLVEQPNAGVSVARNTGIARARHPYVAFLDADDEWLPGYLEEIERLVQMYPNAGIYVTGMAEVFDRKIYAMSRTTKYAIMDYCMTVRFGGFVSSSNAVVPAGILRALGGFTPGVKHTEDWELWLKIGTKHDVAVSPTILSLYHHDIAGQVTAGVQPDPFSLNQYVRYLNGVYQEHKHSKDFRRYTKSIFRNELYQRAKCFRWDEIDQFCQAMDVTAVLGFEVVFWRNKYLQPVILAWQSVWRLPASLQARWFRRRRLIGHYPADGESI